MHFSIRKITCSIFVGGLIAFTGCQKDDGLLRRNNLAEDFANVTSNCEGNQFFGQTHKLAPGDKFVFQVILPNTTVPIPAFYYEQLTDKTIVTPKGEKVYLNSIGNLDFPPYMYFAYSQESDMTIDFYGALYPDSANTEKIVAADWVTKPENGFSINYPGIYFVGKKWKSKFTLTNSITNATSSVNIEYKVVAFETIIIGIGTFDAYKIEGFDKIAHKDESVSWWSPKLGINIKKYSYAGRPGYELSSYHYAVGR